MTTATRTGYPIAATNPMRGRHRYYIWDTETLEDGPYDITAMERALNGEPATLNDAEKYETARRLYHLLRDHHDLARRNKLVAERVGTTDRTIARWNKDGWPHRQFSADGSGQPTSAREADTLEERWASKTTDAGDGHLMWAGTLSSKGVPVLEYKRIRYMAARIAWRILHGADPEGSARPSCGIDLCVKPEHIEDRRIPNMPPRRRKHAEAAA